MKEIKKIKLNKPVLIEGLPGMGNVGKITLDFIIESLKAEKIYEIYAHYFNHCVFIQENGSCKLPTIDIFYKKIRGKDFLFATGNIQPIDERGCYNFCFELVEWFKNVHGIEIITIGGIGLEDVPKEPAVFICSSDRKMILKYKDKEIGVNAFNIVGPILGVSGVLVGVSQLEKIPAITILAETFGNPLHLGINGSRKILKLLENKLKLGLDLKSLDKEIKDIEKEIKEKMDKIMLIPPEDAGKGFTNYIG